MKKYNNNPNNQEKIPNDYFNFLDNKNVARGALIEKLAKYGDPSVQALPIGFKNNFNCDMTFAGIKTAIASMVKPFNFVNNFSSTRLL